MSILLSELQTSYVEIQKQPDLFKETSKILRIPVNLNILRNTSAYFQYSYQDTYRYLDEYSFKDKPFIFDARSGLLYSSYKKSESWLKGLNRHNIQDFGTYGYSHVHGISRSEHVNWLDNKHGLLLSDFLNLRAGSTTPFTPIQKEIFLNYDFQHPNFTYLYAFYLKKGKNSKNLYHDVEFGKMKKSSPRYMSSILRNNDEFSDSLCSNSRNYSPSSLQLSEALEEGYEGVCSRIFFDNKTHPNFPYESSKRWTTPYVAFRYRDLRYQKRQEYYYYSLGDFAYSQGESSNFLNHSDHSHIWFVNYDNLFTLKKQDNSLNISLDLKKIPSNYENFLKVSSLFDFVFSYQENGISKTATFDLNKILNSNANISLSNNYAFYSDFKVSLELKSNSPAELMHDSARFVYSLNTSDLQQSGFLSRGVAVHTEGSEKYFPSQFLNRKILSQFFFLTSDNKQIPFPEESWEKLKIQLEFDDESGIAKVKYHDCFENSDKEIWFTNLKKIAPLKEGEEIVRETLDQAKQYLKDQYDLNDYFWDSVKFTSKQPPKLFDETEEYFLEVKHSNEKVKKQWKDISNIKITVENKNNLAPVAINDYLFKKHQISSAFTISREAKRQSINLSDYQFRTVSQQGSNVEIEASLERDGKIDKKIYRLAMIDDKFENEDDMKLSSLFLGKLFESSDKLVWSLGGAILSGGIVSSVFKFLPFFRRKTF